MADALYFQHLMISMQTECLNCGAPVDRNFCPECGQKIKTHRVTIETIVHDIPHSFFHLDKGFPFTFKQLLLRPGQAIKEYLAGKRINYFSPFAYLILMCTISTIFFHQLEAYYDAHGVHISYMFNQMLFPKAAEFFSHYPALMYCALIPFISLWSWLFNLDSGYNYWENFFLNTYLIAQMNMFLVLYYLVMVLFQFYMNLTPMFVVFFIYFGFAYFTFFNQRFTVFNLIRKIIMFLFIIITYLTGLTAAGFMTPWWNF